MKLEGIDLRTGRVVYWDMEPILMHAPLLEQLSVLKEDLALIGFPGGHLLDVGWYPEFSAEGGFLVSLLKGIDWDEPLFREKCETLAELTSALERAASLAEQVELSTCATGNLPQSDCRSLNS